MNDNDNTMTENDTGYPHALFQYELPINKEYLPLINDLIRMAVIQITAQMLYSSRNSMKFFSTNFIQMLGFILLGVAVYWLVIRKIIIFT